MTGAMLTSLYTFRLILLAFYGPQQSHVKAVSGPAVRIALIVLSVLSLVGGYVDTPPHFGGVPALSNFLSSALPPLEEINIGPVTETITLLCASAVFVLGFGFAFLLYRPQRSRVPAQGPLQQLWLAGWGFDWLYDRLLVRPFRWLTGKSARDLADVPIRALGWLTLESHQLLHLTQSGRVRWYATGLAMGTAVTLVIAFFFYSSFL